MRFYLISRIFSVLTILVSDVFLRYERWRGLIPPSTYKYSNDGESIIDINYEWNPATESWLHFHVRICGVFCNGTESFEVRSPINKPVCTSACFPCDCDLTCTIYGTCCPGIDPKTPLVETDKEVTIYSPRFVRRLFVGNLSEYDFVDKNDYEEFVKENPSIVVDPKFEGNFGCLPTTWLNYGIRYYYAISECPPGIQNDTLLKLCETRNVDDITVDVATPVSDIRNGIVFKNQYCLRCHEFNSSEHEAFLNDSEKLKVSRILTSSYRKWTLKIRCDHYQQFYTLESDDAFLRAVLKDVIENVRTQCEVSFEPPDSLFLPRTCNESKTQESPVGEVHPTSECILDSGVFRNIRHFCHLITKEAYRFYQRQNVFCYMCKDDFPSCMSGRQGYEPYITSHLSFLLGERSAVKYYSPGGEDEENAFLCEKPLEWMDDMDNCRKPECSKGKMLLDVTFGKCKSIVRVIKNLGYKLAAILKPMQDIPEKYAANVENKMLLNLLKSTNISGFLDFSMVVFGVKDSNRENFVEYILINGSLVSETGGSRDDFEKDFLNYPFTFEAGSEAGSEDVFEAGSEARSKSGYETGSETGSKSPKIFSFSPVFLGEDMINVVKFPFGCSQHKCKRIEDLQMKRLENSAQVLSKTKAWHNSAVFKYVTHDHIEIVGLEKSRSDDFDNRMSYEFQKRDAEFPDTKRKTSPVRSKRSARSIWNMEDLFIDLTHSLVCPHVTFDIININSTLKQGEILAEFKYRNKKYFIDIASSNFKDSVSIVDRKLKICIKTFRNEYQKVRDTRNIQNSTFSISLTEKAKRYFALACFVFSAVCLGLTIGTYAFFSQLRTLPGLNTLMLSISLAIAHIFLVVVVEIVGFIKGWLCMGLGLGLHYSWLVACQWMGVCCYHMFSVFRGTETRSTPASVKRRFEWYCFYAFGSSAVIVSLTVIISEITSAGESMGYSPELCIFDTEWSYLVALISFVLPVGLISFSNLVMFLITVKEILDVTRLQESGRLKGRDGVVTYVKLSSLTGIFWLLIILAAKLNNTVLDFISIPLLALQGVFIFFSFTFNANTRKLYSHKMGRSPDVKETSMTASTRVSLANKGEPPTDV